MSNDDTLKSGPCSGCFLLGHGDGATGANIVIELTCNRGIAPEVTVEWPASDAGTVPTQAREQTRAWVEKYLRGYLKQNLIGAFHVTVISTGWFTDRRNELERGAWIGIQKAITKLELPPLRIFAPPTDADLGL